MSGCRNNPLQARRKASLAQQENVQEEHLAAEDREFQRRAEQLDTNNRDLHTRLAQSHREVQLLSDEVTLLRERLRETADLLAQTAADNVIALMNGVGEFFVQVQHA